MALFYAAVRRDLLSLLRFPFLCHGRFLVWDFACLSLETSILLFFFPFLFPFIFVLLMLALSILFLVTVISRPVHFKNSLRVFVTMHRRHLQCWWFLFFFLFLTHTICQRHLWDVWPYASPWVFLASSLVYLVKFFPRLLQDRSRVYYEENSPGIYLFDQTSDI